MDYSFSTISRRIKRSEIREILKLTRKPGIISFGGGLPDSDLFPTEEISKITSSVLMEKGYLALQYGPTQGEQPMINSLIKHMNEHQEQALSNQICVTSSSQQGLDLLSLLFLDNHSPIIMELPSYLGAIQVFSRCGADMYGIPMDEQGMKIDVLENVVNELDHQHRKPKFIYTIPDFQNPAGISLSLDRRKKLIDMAKIYQIPIVEDSPYRELSFSGEILPSLWTLSGGEGVIMLKTFSKMLFPGMRMGWLVGETELVEKIILLKQSVDLCTPSFNQLILAEFIEQGGMKNIIHQAVELYKPKIKTMLNSLENYMPDEVSWSKPRGGMFLWLTLPQSMDSKDLLFKAVENNVAYVIGQPFHCDGSGKNTLRLNYSFPSLEQIERGIKLLAQVIKQQTTSGDL
ncbi:MAG: PLP-dependent aminotransferase family protein [bacterium]